MRKDCNVTQYPTIFNEAHVSRRTMNVSVRKDGASEPNYLMIQAINIAMPLEIPVPGMEGFNVNDVANYGKISIDGNPLNITPERFQNDVSMWYQGLCMDYDFLDRMIHGETDPFIIPIGGKVTVLLASPR